MSIFSKYKGIIIFVGFCVASLILSWSNPNREDENPSFSGLPGNPIKDTLSVFLVPNQIFERIISAISDKIGDIGYFFVRVFRKPIQMEEFESLRSSIETLNLQLNEERSKNRRLERLWKFSNTLTEVNPSFRFIPARVIAVEPTDWFRYITINKGRNHGINVDMAVITQAMYPPPKPMDFTKLMTGVVVGKVRSVQSNSAKVQLITDQLSAVAVTIGPLRDLAILKGQPENEMCIIDEIPSTTHDILSAGDAIVVDERSSIFPPGILVGWISSINRETQFCHIKVRPAFKFSRLNDVLVISDQ